MMMGGGMDPKLAARLREQRETAKEKKERRRKQKREWMQNYRAAQKEKRARLPTKEEMV